MKLSAKLAEGLTTPPSRLTLVHLPLHRGGFGAVYLGNDILDKSHADSGNFCSIPA